MNATTKAAIKAHADANNTVKRAASKVKAPTKAKATKAAKSTPKPVPAKAKQQVKCGCGCGNLTARTYKPGHDARHAGQVARSIIKGADPKEALKALPTDALRTKAQRMVTRHEVTAQAKAAKAEALAAYKAALASLTA